MELQNNEEVLLESREDIIDAIADNESNDENLLESFSLIDLLIHSTLYSRINEFVCCYLWNHWIGLLSGFLYRW